MVDFTKYDVNATSKSYSKDEGLKQYMISIYNYMSLALFVTGFIAYFSSTSETIMGLLFSHSADGSMGFSLIGFVVMFAPIILVFTLSAKINTMKVETAKILYWSYAVLMGLSLSTIFIAYTGESIARTFFISASMFGAASIYGITTKKDLSGFGSFLFMGVIGILIASVVNMFLHSSALMFATSILGVLIFTGLTAYDTQNLRRVYYASATNTAEQMTKIAIMGALNLYMDFINIFIMLLRLMGDRR
jgi:uncharacterized protein